MFLPTTSGVVILLSLRVYSPLSVSLPVSLCLSLFLHLSISLYVSLYVSLSPSLTFIYLFNLLVVNPRAREMFLAIISRVEILLSLRVYFYLSLSLSVSFCLCLSLSQHNFNLLVQLAYSEPLALGRCFSL